MKRSNWKIVGNRDDATILTVTAPRARKKLKRAFEALDGVQRVQRDGDIVITLASEEEYDRVQLSVANLLDREFPPIED